MTFMHAGVPALQHLTAETDGCLEHRFIASVVGCSGGTAAAARPRVCVGLQRYDLSTEAYVIERRLSDTCARMQCRVTPTKASSHLNQVTFSTDCVTNANLPQT